MISFIVTGTGRSGTRHCAAALCAMGIPCGHEMFFNPWGGLPKAVSAPGNVGDSSWMAIPHLPALSAEKVPIVHVVRDPEDVVSSLVGIRFFSDPVHGRYQDRAREIAEYLEYQLTGDNLADAVAWWWRVTEEIANFAHPLRLETLEYSELARQAGYRVMPSEARLADRIPKNLNARCRAQMSRAIMQAAPEYPKLLETALRWGVW